MAQIPALKNQKISGTNILRAEAKAKLVAMSELFQKSLNYEVPQFPATTRLYCMILLAYRPNAYDEDNCLTTIKDWLEPRFIRNKDREWGVGVVTNDRQLNAFAVKKDKAYPSCGITEIILIPEANIRDKLALFVSVFTEARKELLYESQKNAVAVRV